MSALEAKFYVSKSFYPFGCDNFNPHQVIQGKIYRESARAREFPAALKIFSTSFPDKGLLAKEFYECKGLTRPLKLNEHIRLIKKLNKKDKKEKAAYEAALKSFKMTEREAKVDLIQIQRQESVLQDLLKIEQQLDTLKKVKAENPMAFHDFVCKCLDDDYKIKEESISTLEDYNMLNEDGSITIGMLGAGRSLTFDDGAVYDIR